ncbi:MAG: glutaredoxin 3 [Gammaproteobacteria bacterium]|jgi:glutaredoxin 3|nr:glutaredoxin 3 [Gammaproteobacteria bacterium]
MSNSVTLYTTRYCPYCIRARGLLDSKGVEYKDIAVDGSPQLRREMSDRSGRTSVPQIWIGERHIGGYDDMALLESQGRLDELLQPVS